ncbi:hypothetical protein EDC22_10151 [Tepidamorphus gemmatus]|jgi:hypothetical protein|uniref:Uncharacterized protein n=1 Tax=Tepidamorphus gemmatus TaxID=747076 RepID=A0A4R3MH88_9HYPH|nr:hypothetical protein [Tepidamorphus gemmatus]TCT13191.1 hypothetical protein EDC22_10151 [Tepidamorphus gemmatus]
MTRSPKTPTVPGRTPAGESPSKHLDELLDEGLEETFPASDPPVVITPGHEDSPTGDPGEGGSNP